MFLLHRVRPALKSRGGFALIELLVVIALIAVLGGGCTPFMRGIAACPAKRANPKAP